MRLIDADALLAELDSTRFPGAPYVDAGISVAIGKVCDAPTIEERKTGKWIDCGWSVRCSACDYSMPWAVRNYCPNCGARMEGRA